VTRYPHPLDALTDTSLRARWTRRRRVVIPALVALLAVAAFLLWGPIGLGNGPLQVGQPGGEGWADSADVPVALALPMSYAGRDSAVIDGVDFVGGTSYPAPHAVSLEVLATDPQCSGLLGAQQTAGGFAEAGCSSRSRGPLIGSSFDVHRALSPGLAAAAELAAPRPGTCWALSEIAVHYHIGIRHFTATGPVGYAVCATANFRLVQTAMDATDGS
jgi:hypothetical protein